MVRRCGLSRKRTAVLLACYYRRNIDASYEPFRPIEMLQACKRIAKRAGLDDSQFWLHKFRATFCTWHADAGVPIPTIQLWMGHKDLATTMRYLRPNRSAEARAKFNATFTGV